jgi:hypothetical protein
LLCGRASPRSSAASPPSARSRSINPGQLLKLSGSLVVAAITAGGVYSKQRLDDAKTTRDEQQRPAQPD